jgi:hypothetical protein
LRHFGRFSVQAPQATVGLEAIRWSIASMFDRFNVQSR